MKVLRCRDVASDRDREIRAGTGEQVAVQAAQHASNVQQVEVPPEPAKQLGNTIRYEAG